MMSEAAQLMIPELADIVEQHENEQYQQFVDKFKPKRTTDDCYTPENIMEAVQAFVAEKYGYPVERQIRPFWPGADYQKADYPEGFAVVDNPPFSISTQIQRWYLDRGIPFFLFTPALTAITPGVCGQVCYLPIGVQVTYANGAVVPTSFVTSMDPAQMRTFPELYRAIDEANTENLKADKKEIPKYSYPDEIITMAMGQYLCRHGIEYTLDREDAVCVSALDAQRAKGKGIFGRGFLLSARAAAERAAAERAAAERAVAERAAAERAAAERAAAERAAATRWQLSEREREIVRSLGEGGSVWRLA